jgi:hypothetical protein
VSTGKCFLLNALEEVPFVDCYEHCASINATMLCPESRAELDVLDANKTTWLGLYQRVGFNATERLRPREGWIALREGCKPFLAWDPVQLPANNSVVGPRFENPNDFGGIDENVAAYGFSGVGVVHDLIGDNGFFKNELERTTVSISCACQLGGRKVELSVLDKKRLQAFIYANGASALRAMTLSIQCAAVMLLMFN